MSIEKAAVKGKRSTRAAIKRPETKLAPQPQRRSVKEQKGR